MFKSLHHAELGGGYTMRRKIIINAADLRAYGDGIEVCAMTADGDELDTVNVSTEAEALTAFNGMVQQFAEPFQKAMTAANLAPGHRYTLVHLGEFGFPIVEKITFHGLTLTTYAQHSDAVRMVYTPYRGRSQRDHLFYGASLLIFDGWQELPESATVDTVRDNGAVKITRSKYASFSPEFIEDAAAMLHDPIMIYKAYRIGAAGKLYA